MLSKDIDVKSDDMMHITLWHSEVIRIYKDAELSWIINAFL
jgi:hypothetical protein